MKDFIRNETFLFTEYKEKSALFLLNEAWINGNQTQLNNGPSEYENAKIEYIEAMLSLNVTWMEIVQKRKREKEEYFKAKYNMTLDEFFAPQNIERLNQTIKEKRDLLESYRSDSNVF